MKNLTRESSVRHDKNILVAVQRGIRNFLATSQGQTTLVLLSRENTLLSRRLNECLLREEVIRVELKVPK